MTSPVGPFRCPGSDLRSIRRGIRTGLGKRKQRRRPIPGLPENGVSTGSHARTVLADAPLRPVAWGADMSARPRRKIMAGDLASDVKGGVIENRWGIRVPLPSPLGMNAEWIGAGEDGGRVAVHAMYSERRGEVCSRAASSQVTSLCLPPPRPICIVLLSGEGEERGREGGEKKT